MSFAYMSVFFFFYVFFIFLFVFIETSLHTGYKVSREIKSWVECGLWFWCLFRAVLIQFTVLSWFLKSNPCLSVLTDKH